MVKDPEGIDVNETQKKDIAYKKIELYSDDEIEKITLNLDEQQRIVLDIAVDYAKSVVKSRKYFQWYNKPPLVIVQGGAGSGKSTLIDAMCQQLERILRSPGDNHNHPYCIKAAYTGTAAANIKGQTLHSAFSFNFGGAFLSLSDKARDEKRTLLQNLRFVIIDEYSMVPSDMLYQLDLRLKEIKQRTDVSFGGVSVFLLGDILQLRPVKGRFICEIPKSESYHLAYLADPLWEKFNIVHLVQNHRQGEDKTYAEILNRIRSQAY